MRRWSNGWDVVDCDVKAMPDAQFRLNDVIMLRVRNRESEEFVSMQPLLCVLYI